VLRHVVREKFTDVSEVLAASIIRAMSEGFESPNIVKSSLPIEVY
jgi:hypothetical protein